MLLALLLLAAGVGAAARALGREIPRAHLALFALLSVLPFPLTFLTDRTAVPLDHALYVRPWYEPGQPLPYNPFLNDVATMILPWTKAARMALKEGSLPLWNRWNGGGMPLAANSVSAALSPLTLATVFWPLAKAMVLAGAMKILLAAAGVWLWTRELGASRRAAAFASVAFSLGFSFTPPWIFFPHSTPIALLPWTLFLIERLRDLAGRGRTVAALTFVFAFTALAGQPEAAVIGFFYGGLWIAARWATGGLPEFRRVVSAVALAAAIAMALTAFLLIPSLYAIGASGRIGAMSKPYWEPILSWMPHGPQWRAVTTAFFPHTLGNGVGSPMLPYRSGTFPEAGLGYFGIVGWSAALLFVRPGSPRRRLEWVLVALLLSGLAVTVGQWPFAEIFGRLPAISLLFPIPFRTWIAISGVALAALELDRLTQDLEARRPLALLAAAAVPAALAVAAGAVFLRFSAEHAAAGGRAFQVRQLEVILVVLAATAAVLFVARGRPALLVGGLAFLCGGELLYQWRVISRPTYAPEHLFPPTPLVRFLSEQPRPFRVAGEGAVLFPNTNVFAGVEDIRTHDAVERRDYGAFLDATCGYPYGEYFKKLRNLDSPALDFLNVRYVVTEPGGKAPGERWREAYSGADGRVFENTGVLPRAFVPERDPLRAGCRVLLKACFRRERPLRRRVSGYHVEPRLVAHRLGARKPRRGGRRRRGGDLGLPGGNQRRRVHGQGLQRRGLDRGLDGAGRRLVGARRDRRHARAAAGQRSLPRGARPGRKPPCPAPLPAAWVLRRFRDWCGDRRPAHRPVGCSSLEKATSNCWLRPRWW